jgi:NADPH:quinone reductase-like Zn-dependent oxidoreductase/NAD(P)-dependent dehydrogenase (short-subunit alcohol dehydrogenase family)
LLDVAEEALLKEPSSAEFKTLQSLVTQEVSVFWVSFRENDTADMQALQAMVHGFSRTARRENDSISLVNLDIREPLSNLESVSKVVAKLVNNNFWGPENENEMAISNNQVLIPRIRSDAKFNAWVDSRRTDGTTSLQPYRNVNRPLKLEAETPGLLNSLRFVDDPTPKTPLGADEIQVEARAYGINFKDVFVAMGQMAPDVVMAGEAVGVVTAIGENMHKLYKVGDRVACMHAEPFASHPRVNGYHAHVLPQGMSWSDGASVIGIFYTTWWCLDQVAKLRKGQSILVHAGSGGVGQAAIMLAQHVGAEIFVTVGSQPKKDLVMSTYGIPETHIFSTRSTTFKDGVLRLTGGRGVDVVLNSLSGELLDASWETVASFGTFVEIGKADMYKRKTISMTPFDKCVSFVPVDLALMTKARVEMTHDGLREVFSWFEKGIFRPVTPVQTFPMGDISDAFRLIAQRKHVGKLVVVADEGTMVKATPPPAKQLSLEGEGTYVVVGGLGDLGKRIDRLLVSRGATHIVTLSRSIPKDDILQPWLEEIKLLGGSVHMIQCDVTDKESTKRAALECASAGLPPIKGVIYGGMVLSDHALENMTLDQYNTAVKPKVHGTLNVHDAFASPELEFFILLSSTAGILGIAGQANYSAGNTFQDAFALAQNAKPGNTTRYVSLDLGAIEGTGAIDRLSAKSKDVWRRSTIVMTFEELYTALEYAMSPKATEDGFMHSILGFDRESIASVSLDTYTFSNPVFSLLPTSAVRYGEEEEVKESEGGQVVVDPSKLLREAKTFEEAEAVILEATASKFSVFLDSDIPTDVPIAHLALDSLVSIELKNWMVRTFQAPLQASELAGALSIQALSKLLASRSRCISDEIRGRPADESLPENDEAAATAQAGAATQVNNADTDVVLASHGWECCKNSKILPRYPLVDLDDALDYFMDNTGHFCTPKELAVLADAVDELRQPDGPARKAYAHLVKLYNDNTMDSWMYDLISDSVYLKRPHPVAPFSNVMGTHFESPIPHTQVERAAVITLAAFDFQKKLVANEVEPYWYFGMSSCTWQWRWLFNACREPGVDGDKMRMYDGQDYIVVLRRGHVFKVSLKGATYESLKATFTAIMEAVEDEGYWTGILTTDWRPSWAKVRIDLMGTFCA